MVDDSQATPAITRFKTSLTSLTTPTNTVTKNMQSMNQAFNAGVTPIKAQGNALTTLNANLKTTSTTATTMGTKIKSTASQFAGFATGLSATSSGVLQLAAGFRDYNDAQIAVERVTRKNSLAHEALTKATDKLNSLTAKGIKSGKAYEAAQLDVSQAQQMVSIQTQLLGEAQERLFDSQTQFVTSIVPTVLGAIGTLGFAFRDLGGGKGIGGLIEKFKGLGTGIKGSVIPAIAGLAGSGGLGGLTDKLKSTGGAATGLKGNLLGLGITTAVIGGITFAALELASAMNKLALETSHIKTPVSALEATMDKTGKSLQTFKQTVVETEAEARAGVSPLIFALDAVFGTHMRENILKSAGALDSHGKVIVDWDKKVQKIPASFNAAATSSNAMVNAIIVLRTQAEKGQITWNQYFDALAKLKIPGKDFTAIMDEVNRLMKTNQPIVTTATKNLQGFGQSSGEVDDALKKNAKSITEVKDVMAPFSAGLKQNAMDLGLIPQEIGKANPIIIGFGDTLENLKKKFKALSDVTKSGTFTQDLLNYRQAFNDTFVKNPTAITKSAEQWKVMGDHVHRVAEFARDVVAKTTNIQPVLKKAAEEAAKFKDIMASSDKAFKGVFKIDTNVDKIFKDLVKGLPNKLEKKLKLKLKFEQNVDDAKQAFNDFLARATKVDDKSADKMAKEVIDMIDKKFKGAKGPFSGLRTAIESAVADPNTPEKLRQLLLNFKWDDIGATGGAQYGKSFGTEASKSATDLLKQALKNFKPSNYIASPDNTKKKGVFKSKDTSLFNINIPAPVIPKPITTQFDAGVKTLTTNVANIAKTVPAITVNNKQANSLITQTQKLWTNTAKIHPSLTVVNKQANSLIQQTQKLWTNTAKIVPKLSVNTTEAFKRIDAVAKRIMGLENLHPKVTVTVSTTGAGASKLNQSKGDTFGMSIQGGKSNSSIGDIIIENHTHIGDKDFYRMVKAQQGKDRYRFGLG